MVAQCGTILDGEEKLEELLEPLLPGSEQLRLQHSRAIETSAVPLAD